MTWQTLVEDGQEKAIKSIYERKENYQMEEYEIRIRTNNELKKL